MNLTPFLALVLAALAGASTLTPNVLPLIVRNPYLSIWLTGARGNPWEKWPIFWTGNSVGFSIAAKIPDTNTVFPLLGRPQDSYPAAQERGFELEYPEYLGATFDASTTNLTYRLTATELTKPAEVVLSFLSPITPTSTWRQSIPASYLTVHVQGNFDIEIYIDVNGEWVSGDRGTRIKWDMIESLEEPKYTEDYTRRLPDEASIKIWKVSREQELLFQEIDDRAEWGSLYFSGPPSVHFQNGEARGIRTQFARTGTLQDKAEYNYRGIFEQEPLFAFSDTFELSAGANASSKTFTFGFVQNPVVQFASANGTVEVQPLWADIKQEPLKVIQYHYRDLPVARRLAQSYSDQLSKDAFASGSSEYEEIAALSARQVLGGTVFAGTTYHPYLFLKEISSDGNCQTVDVIFPAHPFFLYTNPRWLGHLLEPLLEHMGSGLYPNAYSMHDLGSSFPNNTGHRDGKDEYMPVEECGNMVIMGLALAQAMEAGTSWDLTNELAWDAERILIEMEHRWYIDDRGMDRDAELAPVPKHKQASDWLKKHYKLWKQWTGYLVDFSLLPEHQLSTDDFAGWLANQTNLALKGIIGIRAMSEISARVNLSTDAIHFRHIAETYIDKWQEYGISRDGTHAKLAYTWYGSWTTLYNLFADSLLCFHIPESTQKATRSLWQWDNQGKQARLGADVPNQTRKPRKTFIPNKVYKMQSDWYHQVIQRYGLPLDSRHLYTKSDWEFFAAAITSRSTRKEILGSVARWVNETVTDKPFTDLYETEGEGGYPDGSSFKARPVVGGHFAFLALERACNGKAVEALSFLDKVVVCGKDGAKPKTGKVSDENQQILIS